MLVIKIVEDFVLDIGTQILSTGDGMPDRGSIIKRVNPPDFSVKSITEDDKSNLLNVSDIIYPLGIDYHMQQINWCLFQVIRLVRGVLMKVFVSILSGSVLVSRIVYVSGIDILMIGKREVWVFIFWHLISVVLIEVLIIVDVVVFKTKGEKVLIWILGLTKVV